MVAIISFLFALPVFLACNLSSKSNEEKYGLGFNKFRKEVGLPLLDSQWRVVINTGDVILWLNNHTGDSAIFISKKIRLIQNEISREENHIIGSRKYKTVDGNFFEEMFISISFEDQAKPMNTEFYYRGPEHISGTFLNRNEANQLLQKWVGKEFTPVPSIRF